jgi:hypothetical protein
MIFHRGDRVKLTEKGAEIYARGYRRFAGALVDKKRLDKWRNRRGTVAFMPQPGGSNVSVRWDDRKGPDSYPRRMVELVTSPH